MKSDTKYRHSIDLCVRRTSAVHQNIYEYLMKQTVAKAQFLIRIATNWFTLIHTTKFARIPIDDI